MSELFAARQGRSAWEQALSLGQRTSLNLPFDSLESFLKSPQLSQESLPQTPAHHLVRQPRSGSCRKEEAITAKFLPPPLALARPLHPSLTQLSVLVEVLVGLLVL